MFLKTKHKPVGPVMVVIFWSIVLASFLSSCRAENSGDAPMFIKPPVEHYVISSPLKGQVLNNGEPIPNAKLIRELVWNGDKEGSKEEVFTADHQGNFELPIFELDMAMRGLEQFVAKTYVYLESEGERALIWYNPKMSPEVYSEIGHELHDLKCDLINPEVVTQDTNEQILTRCRWPNMPEVIEV